MDIQNIQLELRRRRIDEIFDFAFYLMRKNFFNYVKLLWLPILFIIIINLLVINMFHYSNEEAGIWSLEQLLLFMILFVEKSIVAQFLIIYNGYYLFDQSPSKRQVWKDVFGSVWTYGWHQIILRGIYIFSLGWLLFFPFRSLIQHFFKSEVILLERLKAKLLNQRLRLLNRGTLDRVIVFVSMDFLFHLAYILFFLFSYNQFLDLFSLSGQYWWLEAELSQLFLSPVICIILIPYWIFHSIAKFIFYIDSRSLREGWDIELQLVRGVLDTALPEIEKPNKA